MSKFINIDAAVDHWNGIAEATDTKDRYNEGFRDGLQFCITDAKDREAVDINNPNNKTHLCAGCNHVYPECPATEADVIFGNGTGNDNICMCACYEPKKLESCWIPLTKESRPEKGGEYLVEFQGMSVGICMYLNGHFRNYGENFDRMITRWMPLPKAKGEEA